MFCERQKRKMEKTSSSCLVPLQPSSMSETCVKGTHFTVMSIWTRTPFQNSSHVSSGLRWGQDPSVKSFAQVTRILSRLIPFYPQRDMGSWSGAKLSSMLHTDYLSVIWTTMIITNLFSVASRPEIWTWVHESRPALETATQTIKSKLLKQQN